MALIEDGEKGRPLELPCPARKSSFAIWRYDRCPPFGRLRRSRFASATTCGRSSAWFFRPSLSGKAVLKICRQGCHGPLGAPLDTAHILVAQVRRCPELLAARFRRREAQALKRTVAQCLGVSFPH